MKINFPFRITSMTFVVVLFVVSLSCSKVKYKYPFQNPELSIEERVNNLIFQMTIKEKVSQVIYEADSIGRLGIPKYNWWNECLHGVARSGLATVFPQAIGMAATWDTANMLKISTAISDEARAKYHHYIKQNKREIYQGLTFWSPNINIFRDPRWGRGMETYGEDPFLTGKLAVQFIKGLQGNDPTYLKVVATAKHYVVHSGPEPERHSFDALTDERDFRETYMPAFKMAVQEAGAYSVMCAYNRYKGEPCCGSDYLLNQILRKDWGFKGYVVSDCGAIDDFYNGHNVVKTKPEAAALAVKSGTDLNCGETYKALEEALQKGLITEKEIDKALKNLFIARFKLGMFDPDEKVKYAQIPYEVVDCKKHKDLALETARKSIVLLKNENNLLPLSKNIKTIAVIGPNSNDENVLLANYNGIPSKIVTPLQGIKDKLPSAKILYAMGCEHAENLPTFDIIPENVLFTSTEKKETGLKAEYFNNNDFNGTPKVTRIDRTVNFNWWDKAPVKGLGDDNFSVRWTGVIVPQVTGDYYIGSEARNGMKVYLNDSMIVNSFNVHEANKSYIKIKLTAGKPYKIKVEYIEKYGDAGIKLIWDVPGKNLKKEALDIAKQADAIVMFMGLSPRLEGEEMKVEVTGFRGGDRLTLDIPAIQTDLIKSVKALGKPVVLVLLTGSAVSINWENENIPAILEAWYGGQAAGTAIADVLFGDYNPAGRLPVTFYKSVKDLPPFIDYNMTGKTYRYFKGESLYEFGYGLSYTTFSYKSLQMPQSVAAGAEVKLSVDVTNSGQKDGEEVVEMYITHVAASVPVPIRSLAGFKRVFIKAGETKKVEFVLTPTQLSVIDNSFKRIIQPGKLIFSIGGKQPDAKSIANGIVIQSDLEITGNVIAVKE